MSNTISLKPYLLMCVMMLGLQVIHAQTSKKDAKEAVVKQLIESKSFVFKARSVSPMGGGLMQLTSDYTLKISGDTLQADLPYFGRAYTAPMSPNDAGINFLTSEFGYQQVERKKDGWRVNIEPNDHRDVRQMLLTVTKSGNATLQVFSNNRQPITFNGHIEERRK